MDEFDDMLDAMLDVIGRNKLPRQSRPTPSTSSHIPHSKSHTPPKSATPHHEVETPPPPQHNNTYHAYVPLDRIDLVLETFTNHDYRKRYSYRDYLFDKTKAIKAITKHGNITPPDLRYNNMLYPEFLIQALVLSRTTAWPAINLDDLIETAYREWLKTIDDPRTYLRDLFVALRRENCYGATLVRLNLNVVINLVDDQIVIHTNRPSNHPRKNQPKTIVITKQQQQRPIVGEARQKIIKFLTAQQAYTTSLNTTHATLEQIRLNHSPEQFLIGILGYFVIKALAEQASDETELPMPHLTQAVPRIAQHPPIGP